MKNITQVVRKYGGVGGNRTLDQRIKRASNYNRLSARDLRPFNPLRCFLSAHFLSRNLAYPPYSYPRFATAGTAPDSSEVQS